MYPQARYLQIHDQGSDAGVQWRIRDAGEAPDSGDWFALGPAQPGDDEREADSPDRMYLSAGNYEFDLSADGGAAFSVQLVDLDHVPQLSIGETLASFASGEQVKVFRLDSTLEGQYLRLDIDTESAEEPAEELSWLLFDSWFDLLAQGSGASTSIELPGDVTPTPSN
jgi:hypothetical protein